MDEAVDDAIIASLLPTANQHCSVYFYFIEVTLRELIVAELTKLRGSKWYKSSLPNGNIMQNYKACRDYQRERRWVESIPFHPIYYLDFPDLATIIEKGDNWRDCFQAIFFKHKEILISKLRSIEPIRNDLAHNRKISQPSVEIVKSVLNIIISSIGNHRAISFAENCTTAKALPERLGELRDELLNIKREVENASPLPCFAVWDRINTQWWFDSEYLGTDLSPIHNIYEVLLPKYKSLPKGRGSGYIAEKWVNKEGFSSLATDAVALINALIKEP